VLPEALLLRIGELRELRVLRAELPPNVQSLPESMSQLINLEELNLAAVQLRCLFPGMGECRELKRLLVSDACVHPFAPFLDPAQAPLAYVHLCHARFLGPRHERSDFAARPGAGLVQPRVFGRSKPPLGAIPSTANKRFRPSP